MKEIKVYDGKYTVIVEDDGTIRRVLRYGEPWRDVIGDNLIAFLARELDECRQTLKWYAGSLHPETRVGDNGENAEDTLRHQGVLN